MKLILPIVLGVICIGLAAALWWTNQSDTAQHETDVNSINDFSNKLETATAHINVQDEALLTMSNNVDGYTAAWTTLSNQLVSANSTVTEDETQLTNLTRQITQMSHTDATNETAMKQSIADLTGESASLSRQLALTQTNLYSTNTDLVQMGKDFVALENRFRIDVGERMVIERKFNTLPELKAQMARLKKNPAMQLTEQQILAGLDVEVRSNGVYHVIKPF